MPSHRGDLGSSTHRTCRTTPRSTQWSSGPRCRGHRLGPHPPTHRTTTAAAAVATTTTTSTFQVKEPRSPTIRSHVAARRLFSASSASWRRCCSGRRFKRAQTTHNTETSKVFLLLLDKVSKKANAVACTVSSVDGWMDAFPAFCCVHRVECGWMGFRCPQRRVHHTNVAGSAAKIMTSSQPLSQPFRSWAIHHVF